MHLENAIDNVTTNGGTRTEDGCITQLLSKLLAHLTRLAVLTFSLTAAFRNGHRRHIGIIRILLHRRPRRIAVLRLGIGNVWSRLLLVVLDENVASREDTLLACTEVLAHPPILVHVLVDSDLVVLLERNITSVRGDVAIQSAGVGKDRLFGSAGYAWGRSVVVGRRRGRVRRRRIVQAHILQLLRRWSRRSSVAGLRGSCVAARWWLCWRCGAVLGSCTQRTGERRLLREGSVDFVKHTLVNDAFF